MIELELRRQIEKVAVAYERSIETVEVAYSGGPTQDGGWGWSVRVAAVTKKHGAGRRVLASAAFAWHETLAGAVEEAIRKAPFYKQEKP